MIYRVAPYQGSVRFWSVETWRWWWPFWVCSSLFKTKDEALNSITFRKTPPEVV